MRRPLLRATWVIAVVAPLAAAAAAPAHAAHAATVRAGFARGGAALRLDGPGLALRQRGRDRRAHRHRRACARPACCAARPGPSRWRPRRAHDGRRRRARGRARGPRRRRPRRRRPVAGLRLAFAAGRAERFLGFGERADAVEHRGHAVDAYVSDGPYPARDRAIAAAVTPPWALQPSDDATYYPVPWLLSTRGYGVLVDQDDRSAFDLRAAGRGRWAVTRGRPRLRLRVFAGPRPADALRRFTAATGRQPAPPADWVFGPWFQTGQNDATPPALERAWTGACAPATRPSRSPRRTCTTCPAAPSAAARRPSAPACAACTPPAWPS